MSTCHDGSKRGEARFPLSSSGVGMARSKDRGTRRIRNSRGQDIPYRTDGWGRKVTNYWSARPDHATLSSR